jgi:hypothetical protein
VYPVAACCSSLEIFYAGSSGPLIQPWGVRGEKRKRKNSNFDKKIQPLEKNLGASNFTIQRFLHFTSKRTYLAVKISCPAESQTVVHPPFSAANRDTPPKWVTADVGLNNVLAFNWPDTTMMLLSCLPARFGGLYFWQAGYAGWRIPSLRSAGFFVPCR